MDVVTIKKNFIGVLISVSNTGLRFSYKFLTNSRNVSPFVRWNKWIEQARREIDLYGIESNITKNVMKMLTMKKTLSRDSFE